MLDLHSALECREAALRRWLPRALRTAGFLLLPWILVLALNVRGHFGKRNLSNAWVWFDAIEVVALFVLAALVGRRHRATSPLAAATAVLLATDAFFDLWSAHRGSAYLLAQVLAYTAELPSAAVLAVLSWYSLAWAAEPRAPGRQRGTAEHQG
ncbi:hypothetical protein E6W39_30895 [Kitasatospora acidiphila]|uniref:Uncharacterized protein n=1 Tax=Kitasatospora acidiphila TaxID=2567942 RepID=A0A540W9Z4_9ACTN|nr:hypothetical protein [Kitasatospora acidiphila]TQF05836.1 hypothetical protein E6W39_30895 [Kitasatospora acidiphila]